MKRTRLIVLLAGSALVLAGTAAQAQPFGGRGGHHGGRGGHGDGGHALMMLRAADANGDNSITRAEVDTLRAEMFAWMDRNADGYLDDADRSPMHARMQAIRAEEGGRFGGARGRRSGAGMMDADADEDGRISRAEFLGRESRVFDGLDADGNGTVTPEELDAAAERRQDRRLWWRN